MTKEQTFVTLPLEVKLQGTEMMEAGRQLAHALSEKEALTRAIEQIKAQHKAQMAAQDAIIEKYRLIVGSGIEFRLIECAVQYDWTTSTKVYVRQDTGEVVRHETITNEERQRLLPVAEVVNGGRI